MDLDSVAELSVRLGPDFAQRAWPPAAFRWRWSHVPGIAVAAMAMVTGMLAFAAEPWSTTCTPASALPYIASTLLLLIAADLMLKPKPPWVRFRDRAVMIAGLLAIGLTLVLSVMSGSYLAWPVLYPLFILPMALPIVVALGIGTVSRFTLSYETWRLVIVCCLVASAILSLGGVFAYESHISCRWAGV